MPEIIVSYGMSHHQAKPVGNNISHTVQKSGRVPCEKPSREPTTKNAIAVPFERCTDDVNNQAEYRVKNPAGNPGKKTRKLSSAKDVYTHEISHALYLVKMLGIKTLYVVKMLGIKTSYLTRCIWLKCWASKPCMWLKCWASKPHIHMMYLG